MQVQHWIAVGITCLALLEAPAGASGGKSAQSSSIREFDFHSVLPLGSDIFALEGQKGLVTVMATAVTPELNGWRRVGVGQQRFVLTPEGRQARHYPRDVQFRVTVSAMRDAAGEYDPLIVKSDQPLNEYLLGMRFQMRIFHGLEMQVVPAAEVQVIGVPADVPSNERIYRVGFKLPVAPVEDRMVLEVLSPEGQRLSRFHFELL